MQYISSYIRNYRFTAYCLLLCCFIIIYLIFLLFSDSAENINDSNNIFLYRSVHAEINTRNALNEISNDELIETTANSPQEKIILNVPIIRQKPELRNGCEVTSLAMLLQYAGINVDKLELAKLIPKDTTPVDRTKNGDILRWGNPNKGFVGDITGKNIGYAVNAGPTINLMKKYLPNRAINLTGQSFNIILEQIKNKKPVVIWTTSHFKIPKHSEIWYSSGEKIYATFDLHAVVLVGFDSNYVYVNNPLSGIKAQKVDRKSFIDSWVALGSQAISYN